MEIREKVVAVLRDANFRSYVRFKQKRREVALAAFDGADEVTLREVKHHIRSVRYAEVCPPFFRRSEDLFASEILASAPDSGSRLREYHHFTRGACATMLAFDGISTKEMPFIRIEDIDFQSRSVSIAGRTVSFSRMTAFIIEEYLASPVLRRPHGVSYHHFEDRCETYLFSASKDKPVGVNDILVSIKEMREFTSEHGFYTDAYLAALNGDFVRARARIERGEDRETVFAQVISQSVDPRDPVAFSETYDAFLALCP